MRTAARFAFPIAFGIAAVGFSACGDTSPNPASLLFNDSTVTVDVATSAGDAIAKTVTTDFTGDETTGGLSSADLAGPTASGPNTTPTNETRNRTCLDANNAVVPNCLPLSSVVKIVIQHSLDATRSNTSSTTGGNTATWTGAVHRSAVDTITRVFTQTTETSRVHSGNSIAHDTTTFVDTKMSRAMSEVAHDSIKAITFALPRSSNPYPTSGSIVRVDSVHVTITAADKSVTKDLVRNVQVIFPADAQGNVTLIVNAKTCSLNLVTHAVTNCH